MTSIQQIFDLIQVRSIVEGPLFDGFPYAFILKFHLSLDILGFISIKNKPIRLSMTFLAINRPVGLFSDLDEVGFFRYPNSANPNVTYKFFIRMKEVMNCLGIGLQQYLYD